MEAVVEVKLDENEEFDVPAIKRELKAAGVNYGINDGACEELVKLTEGQPSGSAVRLAVASGTPAIDGEDGSVRMIVESNRESIGVEGEAGNIDFHERGSFTPVEKGELIAEITLHTSGTAGKNVSGGAIPATAGQRASLTAGEGASLVAEGTELRATRGGDLRRKQDRIEVTDLIRVAGNLDFGMGSIECEGSVRVEGDVLPEFHIRAGGDLVIRQGAIRGSRITAKGNIKVGYVSNSYVECESEVSILKEVLHSTVLSEDAITLSATGRVVGGRLHAQKLVEVGVAGDPKGHRTVLGAGTDPIKNLEEAKLSARIRQGQSV